MIDEPINSNVQATEESKPVGDGKVSAALAAETAETDSDVITEPTESVVNDAPEKVAPVGVDSAKQPIGETSVEDSSTETAEAEDASDSADQPHEDDGGEVDDASADATDEDAEDEDAEPIELIEETEGDDEETRMDWYILKVQVNRESSICEALERRVKVAGLERYFDDILVPTEDVREFTKSGKQKVVKRKLYPGYIVVRMSINDDTWFLVRETPGIGDFTGSAGKPTPMASHEIDRILKTSKPSEDDEDKDIKTTIKFKPGDKVRVKEGYFQNFEGDVESIDEANGRITVMINIFGRSTPVELEHWQVEDV